MAASNAVILDDDDIRMMYSSSVYINEKGSSSSNPILVDDVDSKAKDGTFFGSRKRKRVIYINVDDEDEDDDIDKTMCEICTDEKPKTEFFTIKGCNHRYCYDCISYYVSSKLQENSPNIVCPFVGCLGRLEIHDCRWILPREVFERWSAVLCEAMIPPSERFYCPYNTCSALLINEGADQLGVPNLACPNCRKMFCAKCKVPWHSGMTCQENSERGDDDIKLISLAQEKRWSRCPKCKVFVEKISGCDMVRCSWCSTNFVYGQSHNSDMQRLFVPQNLRLPNPQLWLGQGIHHTGNDGGEAAWQQQRVLIRDLQRRAMRGFTPFGL